MLDVPTDRIALDHGLLEQIRAAVGEHGVEEFVEQAARVRLRDLALARILDELRVEAGQVRP